MTLSESLVGFTLAACILTLTPGLDTVLVLRQLTTSGASSARKAALGVALCCLIWGACVALGLGMLMTSSITAFVVVKTLGAIYLLWQGFMMLRKPSELDAQPNEAPVSSNLSAKHAAFFQGFWTNVLNPKVGVFYVTLLPQFSVPNVNAGLYMFCLAVIHVLLSLIWFMLLIAAGQTSMNAWRHPATGTWMNRVTGVILIGFGLKLGASDISFE